MAVHNAGLTPEARELVAGVKGVEGSRAARVNGEIIPLRRYDVSKDVAYWEVVQRVEEEKVFLMLHDGRGPVQTTLWPESQTHAIAL